MKNSIPHHVPVISDLENVVIADEISCVDVFLVDLGATSVGSRHSRCF